MTNSFNDNLILKEALQIYFSRYHFENGGYDLNWFKIKIGAVFLPLPNIKARVEAVKIHDIHHILTEYTATLKGEAEIGAWELASGCGKYWAAWLLNLGSFFYGLLFFPGALWNAFIKGRHVNQNLYYNKCYDETLLNKKVGQLRHLVGTNIHKEAELLDYLAFATCTSIIILSFIFFATFFTLISWIIKAL